MDDKTEAHIRELCTRIGCVMEDVSVIALIWSKDDGLSIEARLQELHNAQLTIATLVDEAQSLLR
jgi:hypothetical protein